uniref:LON peptidase substrate-binding domain-containing protein n=1 Tax=Pseudomonas aeruginosa TaxID=287 RepID=UPI002B4040ED
DFVPIIPINEQETEQDKALVIPTDLTILPLRNTVLFPGVVIPITVGRDKSIKAVSDVYKGDKLIGVLAQKDANIEEPEPGDLCKIGTV